MSLASQPMGWLDFGQEDQRRARLYLEQFKEDNTLDELGLGVIRDALAERIFPATNTIMTRTRYLIFLPAIFLTVEKERLSGGQAERRMKALENRLREALAKRETERVIGNRAKEDLVRYPSSIYWNALRQLGLFLHPNRGLASYLDHLADFHEAMRVQLDDDKLSHRSGPELRNWDGDLVALLEEGESCLNADGELPEELDFRLTADEAGYLKGKYLSLAERSGPSLISHQLKAGRTTRFSYPWDIAAPPELKDLVEHARCFSLFAQGVTWQYYHLLESARRDQGLKSEPESVAEIFTLWWSAARDDLQGWQVGEFLGLTRKLESHRRNDEDFMRGWLERCVAASTGTAMLDDTVARGLIRTREETARPRKARLKFPDYLKRWEAPDSKVQQRLKTQHDALCYALEYRARIGSTFIQDISMAARKGS